MILVFRDVFTIFLCLHIHTHRSLSSLSFSLGNVGSPQNPDVSIGPGLRFFLLPTDQLSRPLTLLAHHSHPTFRSDFLHFCIDFMSDETEMAKALQLGHGAYFSESAYELEDYRDRYWGGNYKRLQEIKHKIDPTQRFSCRHCVE
mmetsp:Transcript_22344/g.34720  ORF Transcript_22344/g.34720 Transcript_22344/m.34720 type:complete len:145 (-) Transcript_22344:103-537(-)